MSSNEDIEQQQATIRKNVTLIASEKLLEYWKDTHQLLVAREVAVRLGLRKKDLHADQHYRLTAYTLEQELLRRLSSL